MNIYPEKSDISSVRSISLLERQSTCVLFIISQEYKRVSHIKDANKFAPCMISLVQVL